MTQQRKLWITITSVVLVISLLASILLVFADEYVPTVQPTPSPIYTGQPFTQPGNGQNSTRYRRTMETPSILSSTRTAWTTMHTYSAR